MTRPSLAWSSALKYTTDKLDFITDPDMYLMIENNMRSGIATISHRYAQANNPLVQGYDPSKLNSWITYLDANNTSETAMSKPLPVGKFYTSENKDIKAAVVKRSNRMLKHKMYRYFTNIALGVTSSFWQLSYTVTMTPMILLSAWLLWKLRQTARTSCAIDCTLRNRRREIKV